VVKQEPVNLTHQTIFAIIPYVNLYAYYRIQRLGMYFLIFDLAQKLMDYSYYDNNTNGATLGTPS